MRHPFSEWLYPIGCRKTDGRSRPGESAYAGNTHLGAAPLQGLLSKVLIKAGEQVKKAQPLFVIEAMKMETTISAPADGTIRELTLKEGTLVNTGDLVLELF